MYTIGRLAKRARLKPDSIRFYERQGLVAPAQKTPSGYRLYTDAALRRIHFIKHAQRCGLALAEIGELLQMHEAQPTARSAAYRLATSKKVEIDQTIIALQAMSDALASLAGTACAEGEVSILPNPDESPALVALEARLASAHA